MRCHGQQQAALATGFEHQSQVPMLEVAHATVNEPRAAAGGASGEVVALEQRHAHAPQRGLARHARAGDPASDHQQIEPLV
jgi:hypothetical protein